MIQMKLFIKQNKLTDIERKLVIPSVEREKKRGKKRVGD